MQVILDTAGGKFMKTSTSMPTYPSTLARLSFWVSPERMAEFATDYEAKVVPILKAHGLTESSERGRATPTDVFSRLFEVASPSEVEKKRNALQKDPVWTAVLERLGTAFGTGQADGLIQYGFGLYSAQAGPGKVVSAGPGKVVPAGRGTGHWRTYDATDGLAIGVAPHLTVVHV